MKSDSTYTSNVKVWKTVGEMTVYSAAENKESIMDALRAATVLEIDLTAVTEIDSSGLQLLVLAKREAERQQKSVKITGHSEAVIDAFDLCKLSGYFGDPIVLPAKLQSRRNQQ